MLILILSACNHDSPYSSTDEKIALPIIRIETVDSAPILDRENWVTMTFSLEDPNNESNNISAISNQQIRGRGNSSWTQVPPDGKKPYRIRFRDTEQQGLMGLPPARNWVLMSYGQILNDTIAFELGRRLGLVCTPSFHHVELYLNDDYRGIYLLTEHRQADPNEIGAPGRPRVDFTEGWFVEIDRYYDEDPKFRTPTEYNFGAQIGLPIMVKTPEVSSNDINDPIFDNVKNDWNNLMELMSSTTFPDNGWRDLVDIDSFAKYFMIQTIMLNIDVFRVRVEEGRKIGSTYYYRRDNNSKIKAGPLWDLSWSLTDTTHDGRRFTPDSFQYPIVPFWRRFFDDPVFLARYKEIWNENYQSNIRTMLTFIDKIASNVESSDIRNNERWNSVQNFNVSVSNWKNFYNSRIIFLNTVYNLE